MQATLAQLDAVFHTRYSINHDRPPGRGNALGRYAADRYYGGGAWYVSTLAAAEFCFRAAPDSADAALWIDRGDAYLATVRAFTPADGALSEQFDPTTGEQTSARHLAWSYAAFISCLAARRAVSGRS
jgi:glucoamylase